MYAAYYDLVDNPSHCLPADLMCVQQFYIIVV